MPNIDNPIVPDASEFRDWLKASLEVLDLSAHHLGEISGLGKNAARKFLSGDQADLRLNSANSLVRGARKAAGEKGVTLPPLCLDDLDIAMEEGRK